MCSASILSPRLVLIAGNRYTYTPSNDKPNGWSGQCRYDCSSPAFALIYANNQRDLYLKSIVPIGILFSGSLILSNTAYLTWATSIRETKTSWWDRLSVSFIQMLKAFTPVAILLISALFKIQHLNQRLILIVLVCLLLHIHHLLSPPGPWAGEKMINSANQ